MWISLLMVCFLIFFIIFAAKSKEHFPPKTWEDESKDD